MKKSIKKKFEKLGVLPLLMAMITLVIATFAVIILAPVPAYAESVHKEWGKTKQNTVFDKRIKELHDKLKLSSAQEPAWNEFVEKSKPEEDLSKFDNSKLPNLPAPELLDRMLSLIKAKQQDMESRAEVVKSFYNALTAQQQTIFDESFHSYLVSVKNNKHLPSYVTA